MRRGFTLVETLVALVLVQFGLLAVAATEAVTARQAAAANRIARSRDVARNRVELLRPAACATTTAGSVHYAALAEHWSVQGDSVAKTISDSVSFALPGGKRGHFVLRVVVLCGR